MQNPKSPVPDQTLHLLTTIAASAARGFTSGRPGEQFSHILELAHYARPPEPTYTPEGKLVVSIVKVRPASNWLAVYVDGLLRYSEEDVCASIDAWLLALARDIAESWYGVAGKDVEASWQCSANLPEYSDAAEEAIFRDSCALPPTLAEYRAWLKQGRRAI